MPTLLPSQVIQKNAANSRAKEATDFPTGENELSEVTDSLAREMTTFARVEQAVSAVLA